MFTCAIKIFLLMLIAALLGFFIAWLLRNILIKKLEEQLDEKSKLHSNLSDQYSSLQANHGLMQSKYEQSAHAKQEAITNLDQFKLKYKGLEDTNLSLHKEQENYQVRLDDFKAKADAEFNGVSEELNALQLRFGSVEEENKGAKEKENALAAENKKLQEAINELKGKHKGLENTIAQKQTEVENLNTKYSTANELNDQYNSTLILLKRGKVDLEAKLKETKEEAEKDKAAALAELKADQDFLKGRLDEVSQDNERLKAQLAELQNSLTEAENQSNPLASSNDEQIRALESANVQQTTKIEELSAALAAANVDKSRLEEEEDKLKALQQENKTQQERIKQLEADLAALKTKPATKPAKKGKESQEDVLKRIQEKAKDLDFGRIGTATIADKDDLKTVKGIGPFIEKKLHALGIYTFRQIANLTPEDEDKVNGAIEFFPGRVRRDQWAKQSKELAKKKEDEKNKDKDQK